MPIYVPLIFFAVGCGIAILTVGFAVFARRARRAVNAVPADWLPAVGTVVDERSFFTRGPYNELGAFVRRPTVAFREASGRESTFVSGIYGSFMPRPGATVAVFYDPADPSRARIGPGSIPRVNAQLTTAAVVLGGCLALPLAAVFVAIGVVLLRTR